MGISRLIKCDCCKLEKFEDVFGVGWTGWGKLSGVVDSTWLERGEGEITLCPECLKPVVDLIEKRRTT